METAVRNVIDGNLSIRGVPELYDLPYSTQHGKLKNRKAIAAELNPRVGDRIVHPTLLSPKKKEALFGRILSLEDRRLGLTFIQVRRAVLNLAEVTDIKHPWNTENKFAEIHWFREFLRRHPDLSLLHVPELKIFVKKVDLLFNNSQDMMNKTRKCEQCVLIWISAD
jgi:hypothetical protein